MYSKQIRVPSEPETTAFLHAIIWLLCVIIWNSFQMIVRRKSLKGNCKTTGLSQTAFLSVIVFLWTWETSSIATQALFQFKSPHLAKYRPNVFFKFYRWCIGRWLVWTWDSQVSQNAFFTNQRQWRRKTSQLIISHNFGNTTVVESRERSFKIF